MPHAPCIPVNSFPDSPELFDHIPVTYEEQERRLGMWLQLWWTQSEEVVVDS